MEINPEWKAMFAAHITELNRLRGLKKAGQMPKFKDWQYNAEWETTLTEEQQLAYQWYLRGEDACQTCAGTGYVPPFASSGQSVCPVCHAGLEFRPIDRVANLRAQSDLPKIYQDYTFDSWFGLQAEMVQGKEDAVLVGQHMVQKRGDFFSLSEVEGVEVKDDDGFPRNGLLLYGIKGVGKTSLASTIGNMFIHQGLSVAFVLVSPFLSKLKGRNDKNYQGPSGWALLENLMTVHLLILDEMHVQNPSDYDIERMFDIIRPRYYAGLPTIITANTDDLGGVWSANVFDPVKQMCHRLEMRGKKFRKTNDKSQVARAS